MMERRFLLVYARLSLSNFFLFLPAFFCSVVKELREMIASRLKTGGNVQLAIFLSERRVMYGPRLQSRCVIVTIGVTQIEWYLSERKKYAKVQNTSPKQWTYHIITQVKSQNYVNTSVAYLSFVLSFSKNFSAAASSSSSALGTSSPVSFALARVSRLFSR